MASHSNLLLYFSEILLPECQNISNLRQLADRFQNESLDNLLFAQEDSSYPSQIKDFLNCSIIMKAEASSDPIGYEKSQRVVDAYLNLCQARNLGIQDYLSHLNSVISRELLACEDLNTVFLFGKIALNLKNYVSDLSMIDSSLDISYSPFIFELALGTDKEKITEGLKALIKAKDLQLDSTGAEHAIVENALSWVENNQDFYGVRTGQGLPVDPDHVGTQIINGLLLKICPNEQEFKDRLDTLTIKYGSIEVLNIYKENYTYEDQNEIFHSSEPSNLEIKSLDLITINADPLKTSNTDNKKIYTYIYKGKIKATNQEICIKKIRAEHDVNDLKKFNHEVNIMRELSGKQDTFLKFYGSFIIDRELYILMEYVEDNLMDVLRKVKLTEVQQIHIAKKLIQGFSFLSQKKIYHRDIKPHNILITSGLDPKIIDFGITVFDLNPNLSNNTHTSTVTNSKFIQGTLGYMSPEQKIAFTEYNRTGKIIKYGLLLSDVFSLGITLFQMATGLDVSKYEEEIHNEHLKAEVNKIQSNELKKMITMMIDKKPSNRRTFIEIVSQIAGKTITIVS